MTTTRSRAGRLPHQAVALRLPIYDQGMRRSRERWGFDLNAPDALERARAAVAATPQDPAAALLHAAVLSSRGDPSAAESEARRAAQLDPASARAHTSLSTLLVARGADQEGLAAARRAADLDPLDAVVQYNRGLAEWAAGDRRAARQALRLAGGLLDSHSDRAQAAGGWRRILRRD